jgi:NTE family protein
MPETSADLSEAPLFECLTSGELAALRERVRLRAFKPQACLLECGQDSPGLYVIRSGLVAVFLRSDAGQERELARLGRGECVGEMALVTGEPCSAMVHAITDAEAWFIERDDFVDLVNRCPGLWRNLSRIMSQRLVRASRHVAAQPLANTIGLIMACAEEEATALAVAIAASLARQTTGRVLLVDARAGSVLPASAFATGEPATSLCEMLRERSLLKRHEVAPDPTNGLSGARIATLCDKKGQLPCEEDSLCALDCLSPLYHYILLLFRGPPAGLSPLLLDRARSIVTVIAEEEVTAAFPWLDHLCRPSGAQGKVEVAILTAGPTISRAKQAIEELIGRPIRHLPKDGSLLRQMVRERAPLTEARRESPFSRAVSRLARHVGEMEVGLALGAGAAKGFAHLGVLQVLEENGVPIDYIAGCSIGAIVGALYAGRFSLAQIERILDGADRKIMRWTIPLRALWSDAGLKKLLEEPAPTVRFRELAIPFAAIATDLANGLEVALQEGLVWRAVQASVSIPGIFPPTVISGRYLVDGGLVNPVPTQTVRRMGANIVVAVDLMSPVTAADVTADRSWQSVRMPDRRPPNLVEILWRSNEIMQAEITARSAATADVTIRPRVGRSRWSDFSRRGRAFRAAGEEAARNALPELRRLLPFLGTPSEPRGSGR